MEKRKALRGDTNIIAIIVIAVIIIAVAYVFRQQLTSAINSIFERLNGFINSTPTAP